MSPARSSRGAMAPGSVELHGGGSRVVLVPALGGRLTALETGGRQWLLPTDLAGTSRPVTGGLPYEDRFAGGYDECFPTRAACTLPADIPGYGGLAFPEHGELWSQACSIAIETADDGQRAVCRWEGEGSRFPYRAEREVHMRGDGNVVLRYRVENNGAERMPFLWCSDITLPLTDATRLTLPDGLVATVIRAEGSEIGAARAEHRWPRITIGKRSADLSRPATVGKRFAARWSMAMPPARVSVHEGSARLDIVAEPSEVPNLALEIVRRPGSIFGGRGAASRLTLAPAIGAPDSLAESLGTWRSAHWIEPNDAREWHVRLRGGPGDGRSGG